MSNLALYRKYRPQTFDEVIGQEHICRTLKSQVENNSAGHAYLFCGTRGVGKTSIAKIFAKALNCMNPVNGSPCMKCPACIDNMNQASINILEIDAASNNGVDNIRELKEKILYPPVNQKYRIYIIDEVHMLSTSAFNALLKTLEEPPSYAIFILATTEAYKIPATILSRCTRFDFKLVSLNELCFLVKNIFDKENITASDDVITAICKAGEGSVRDTLSIADMLASYCNKNITYDSFIECMGSLKTDFIYGIARNIKLKNISDILIAVKELSESGKNFNILIKDMMEFYRNALIVKTISKYKDILNLPEDIVSMLEDISGMVSEKELLTCLQKLGKLDSELRYSLNPRLLCETTFIDMALYSDQTFTDIDIDSIIERKLAETIKNNNLVSIKNIQFSKNDSYLQEEQKDYSDIKINKINDSIDEIEKDIIPAKNITPAKDNFSEKKVETTDITNVNDSLLSVKDSSDLVKDKNKIVSLFIRKAREADLPFITIACNYCEFSIIGNKLYFITNHEPSIRALKSHSVRIKNILKDINDKLDFEITIDKKQAETDEKIEKLKNKFGKNINIKS